MPSVRDKLYLLYLYIYELAIEVVFLPRFITICVEYLPDFKFYVKE